MNKHTSMPSKSLLKKTELNLLQRLQNGTNKLLIGKHKLVHVWKKKFQKCFQWPTAGKWQNNKLIIVRDLPLNTLELSQLKKKSIVSVKDFKNKLMSGLRLKKNTFSLKLSVFNIESLKKSTPGKLNQLFSLVKSRNSLTNASLQKKQRLLNTKSVWMKEELPNVLNLKNTWTG